VQVDVLDVHPELAGDDARDVEDVLDELRLGPRVALDGFQHAAERLGLDGAGP